VKNQGMTDISENTSPAWVGWTRKEDAVGNEYFVHKRNGYPPLVRRRLFSAGELRQAYLTDPIVSIATSEVE